MRVHVVGAGAIGGFVGAMLSRAGNEVTLVDANAAHVAAIRADGLRIVGAVDVCARVPAVAPEELSGSLGVVLLAVKARHTRAALDTIAPLLSVDGCVVSLQNGHEEDVIAEVVGPERTVGALVTFGGYYEAPGVIRYAGPGTLALGELDGSDTPRVRSLAALLDAAHPVQVSANIVGCLWSKTAIGAAYFATAVEDEDVPVLLADPARRAALGRLVAEVAAVARLSGVRCEVVDGFDPDAFPDGDVDASWDAQAAYWNRVGARRTGVWRDLAIHRRPTEVDQALGPVLDAAERSGVDAPCVRALVDAVHAVEDGCRELGVSLLDELEAI